MTTCTAPGRHQTYVDYKRGCTCPAAHRDHLDYRQRLRDGNPIVGWTDSAGTVRRIQGLRRLKRSVDEIAEAAGIGVATVKRISGPNPPKIVTRRVADAIRIACRRLGEQPGESYRTANHAERQRFVPLLAWDDDIDDPGAVPEGLPDQCVIRRCTNKAKRKGSRCWSCEANKRTNNDYEEVAA